MIEDPAKFLTDAALEAAAAMERVMRMQFLHCVDCRHDTLHERRCPICGGGLVQVTLEKGEADAGQSD